MTGAGGGGCALVLINGAPASDVKNLEEELEKCGFRSWEVTLGVPGVKVREMELDTTSIANGAHSTTRSTI